MITRLFAVLVLLILPTSAGADERQAASGGAPGPSPAAPITLSIAEAVRRGLEHNLAAVVERYRLDASAGAREESRGELLPHVSAALRQSQQVTNLAAFGFSGFGDFPDLIGPFSVFDARLAITAPVFDAEARQDLRASGRLVDAAQADYRAARERVVLAVGRLYLEARADEARVAAAHAELDTADVLVRLAEDQKSAGLVPQIDVVRQQVQREAARARVITVENARDKRLLDLARAIGVPATQPIVLTSALDFAAAPDLTLESVVAEAAAHRPDLAAARARVQAAEASRRAASSRVLPTLHVDADVGGLGSQVSSALRTYSVAATVRMPVFEGGATRARVRQSEAVERQREAEAADLEAGIGFELQAALLDLKAAAAQVEVARAGDELARQQLDHAQDRFRAGVASTIELVQAQDAVARASEQYIASVLAHNLAKGQLARAMGSVEDRFVSWIGGRE